ncbi:Detected protein of unknown function [Hibiscus syriacus]|uniref:Uncharacterized protein n=1 Tax=Hibiscus syriacus TaxID=106335 RepID=A0A6A3AP44_HIBSY|nr:uncharacterized protein LOC120124181 [Hibiscus syriacus]XP_038998838.1 uncharacterized protein LOC120124181 [Hibiscus syriacus]KAE8705956.1 Detected protein of unknown function [Hibiscus syriacus]
MGLIGKLKRKDIDQVNDDFSDFSLSSPATKIRRLDADLPPIIEEDSFPENHERAIVLFNPNTLLDPNEPPSCFFPPYTRFFSLHSDYISGFKNQFLRATDTKSAETEENKKENEGCLAMVPWVPSQIPSVESRDLEQEIPIPESMETDEMDVEENCSDKECMQEVHGYQFEGLEPREAFHHWTQPQPQQHCMIPQPPRNPFTPIT